MGTSHMLTLAWALDAANAASSRARRRARGSSVLIEANAVLIGSARLTPRRERPMRRPCDPVVAVRKRIIVISLPLAQPGSGKSQDKTAAKLPEQNGQMSQKLDII